MLTLTPGENRNFEGSTVTLSMEEQKGEPEKEVFRVVKFQKIKPEAISLVDIVLNVQLYNLTYETFFKATFDDPTKIVAGHKIPMDIVIYTLEEVFSGNSENAIMSYEKTDGKEVLLIQTAIETKIFNRTLSYKFSYRFKRAKMSFEQRVDMKLGVIEQRLNELEVVEEKMNFGMFIPGKRVMEASFEKKGNNKCTLADNGTTLTHTGATGFNTTTLCTLMKNTVAYRARFRWAHINTTNVMFGVVSTSFSQYGSYPQGANYYGWVVYYASGTYNSSYGHNGSFENPGGCFPYAGSIITVEFYPKQGSIQYFVNSAPAGRYRGCTFNNGDCRFAVVTYDTGSKLKLLSVEQIQDVF